MAFDAEDALPRSLHEHNPWWEHGVDAFTLPPREKSDFYHLVRPDADDTQFEDQRLLGLVGRRGAGKTTLLEGFVHHQLQSGYEPEQFLYLPFDANPLYQLGSDDQLARAVREYERRILGRIEPSDPHFVMLDDVHRIEHPNKPDIDGWATPLATVLADDPGRYAVVTASAAVQVQRELDRVDFPERDSDTQAVLPEKFRDYLYTRAPGLETPANRVSPTSLREGPNSIPAAIESGSRTALTAELREKHERVADARRRIESTLHSYHATGGVVAYARSDRDDDETAISDADFERLRNDTRDALYQEVPALESIKTIDDLERLCALAASDRARDPISFQALADAFDVDRRTITDSYLPALEALYVLTGATEYDNQRPRDLRLYLRDPGLVTALSPDSYASIRDDVDRERLLARITAFDHTMRLAYGIDAAQGRADAPVVEYYRTRDGEVDYVFEVDDTPLPIALAYHPSERTEKRDALAEFTRTYDTPLGFLLHGDPPRDQRPIQAGENGLVELPYWFYLLLC